MGKISDALERHKREKSIKTEHLLTKEPERFVTKDPRTTLAKKYYTSHEFSQKVVVLSAPDSVDAENFKILRTHILFARDHERPRTILVTSTFPGEGKTFVSSNLAVSIAMGVDEHVLLVDCDFRRPQLHKMLGYTNTQGLNEYLTGKKQLPDLIIHTKVDKLSFLPAGKRPSNPAELLSSKMMEEFLKEIKGRYEDRFIIIDTTPSQITPEANILARYVDVVILIVMAQKSPKEVVLKTIQDLGKEKILGIVFNGYSQAYKGYDKYYKKYYGKKDSY